MFQRILCATDFSDTAEAAWEIACDLARTHRADLVLVHAFTELPVYPEVAVASVQRVWEEQRLWVQQALDQRVGAATARGLKARSLLETGPAPETIEARSPRSTYVAGETLAIHCIHSGITLTG